MKNWTLIGKVGVDSGQLLITDPCYIDSEWKKEPFESQYDGWFIFPDGKEEMVKHCSKRWFELIDRGNNGEIKIEERPNPKKKAKSNFSYNAVSQATIQAQHAQLKYEQGHDGVGVAFRTGFGDGCYPVYAKIKDIEGWGRRITEVKIVFCEE